MDGSDDARRHWLLEPDLVFLNHGSFGACPLPVLEEQDRLRRQMERDPVRFFTTDLEKLYDAARRSLAEFLRAEADNLAFVPNATTGVNSVLRSLELRPGDELLTTDHEYNACANTLRFVAGRAGARVVVARVPFPLSSPERVLEAVLEAVTPRTRLLLVDHITSQTGLVLPLERLLDEMQARGIDTLVDGAHAPGMLDLDLGGLLERGATYYAGNCHKWLCAPKGSGFLLVRRDRLERVRPAVISHGANAPEGRRSRFRLEFDWTGTFDPTPMLCVPAALRFMETLHPRGWPGIMADNRALLCEGRRILCDALDLPPPCPEEMLGSLASFPISDGDPEPPASPLYLDALQLRLLKERRIQVPVIPWPAPPRRLVRISAQRYNAADDYRRLAEALREMT